MSKNPSATHTSSASFKARFWDRFASGYAGGAIGDWAGYERSLARTRELLGPGASVLEIGCGTGSTALTLSLFTGPYLATDIAPAYDHITSAIGAAMIAPAVSTVSTRGGRRSRCRYHATIIGMLSLSSSDGWKRTKDDNNILMNSETRFAANQTSIGAH